MRRISTTITFITLLVMILTMSGCKPASLRYDKLYTEYIFVGTEGVFVPSGRQLTINSKGSFTMVFDEDLTFTGVVDHIDKEQTIYLDSDENTSTVVKNRFKDKILSDPNNVIPIDILDMMMDSIDITEQMHYHKNYIFSSRFISAHRYIDTALYSYGEDYGAFEGVYSVKNYGGLMLLRHGEIYIQDPDDPKAGQFPIYAGSYVYANDFLTMSVIDYEGNPQPEQKYLVAEVTLPFELQEGEDIDFTDEDSNWYDTIEDQLDDLKGKKVKVLVLCFFTYKNF